jgi:hypothetical protein
MGGKCSTNVRKVHANILSGEIKEKELLGRFRRWWRIIIEWILHK